MASSTRFNIKLWLLERLSPSSMQSTLWLAAIIGFLGALSTVAFREFVSLGERFVFGHTQGLVKAAAALPWWERTLIPALGGVAAGWVLEWANRCKSNTASDYMEAISLKDGAINVRQSLFRSFSSIISIVTGSSIGREGSMVQLSALVGAWFARWGNTSAPKRRLLVACGGAAGITAAYNAPIAGALFISEIVFRSIAAESLGPLVVASVIANLTVHAFLGYHPVYEMPTFKLVYSSELILHAVLGVTAGLLAPLFLGLIDGSRSLFRRLPFGMPFRLGVGGAVVGLISVLRPEVWGNGYSVVNEILANQWMWGGLLFLMLCKVFATAATAGSGAVGGIFTPTLFVGAALGFLFGEVAHKLWPTLAPASVYAATGMAAFLAATTYAPLTAILMIFEMTGNYQIMLPVMLASVLAYYIASMQRDRSVYADSLKPDRSKAFSEMSVKNMMRTHPPTVKATDSLAQFEETYVSSRWQNVYVVDDSNHFLGAVSLHDLRPVLEKKKAKNASLPPQFLRSDYPRVSPDMTLGRALEVFAGHSGERLPVVDEAENILLGFISKTDLMLLLQESVA